MKRSDETSKGESLSQAHPRLTGHSRRGSAVAVKHVRSVLHRALRGSAPRKRAVHGMILNSVRATTGMSVSGMTLTSPSLRAAAVATTAPRRTQSLSSDSALGPFASLTGPAGDAVSGLSSAGGSGASGAILLAVLGALAFWATRVVTHEDLALRRLSFAPPVPPG